MHILHKNSIKIIYILNSKIMIFNCKNCEYIANNHWNLKMHNLSSHTTKEERSKQKYYCDICDNVFFCSAYYNKHINGKRHKNMQEFIDNNKI